MKTPISLTARLSLLFAGSAACVLLFSGLLFEHAANNRFLERDSEELEGKMALLQDSLGHVKSYDSMEAIPRRLNYMMTGHPGIAVTMAASDGRVIFSIGPTAVVNHLLQGAEAGKPQPVIWSLGARTYRIIASRATLDIPDSQPANVAIAFDISRDQEFMEEFTEFLWFGMVLAVLAMGWLAWVAVRQGLSPLNEVSSMMANISAQELGMPIPIADVPQELEQLVASFNTMLARLDDSFRRLSEFSTDIAHELRTPIQNLIVQTEVTLTGAPDAAEYRTNLQSNLEEYARLSRMISDMLFLAKADNRLLAPHKESIDLRAEVAWLLDFYEALASDRGVRLVQSGAAIVQADRLMIQRALSNLVSNAIRYTPEGMAVEVTLTESRHHAVVIEVANPGTEIAPEHLPKIFDRLYRVDSASHEGRGENVGLGLAMTKVIVEMHGGTISVVSENNRTCFTVTFPAVQDQTNDACQIAC